MTVAQRFAQIFGTVYLLVGFEVSSRLHRYSRKSHPVRVSLRGSSTRGSCSRYSENAKSFELGFRSLLTEGSTERLELTRASQIPPSASL